MSLVPLGHEVRTRTTVDLVRRAAAAGRRPVFTASSADGSEHSVRGEDLAVTVGRAGALLAARGIGPGSRVGILLDNRAGLEAWLLHLAAQWIGAVAVPIGTRLSTFEVREAIEWVGVSLLVSERRSVPIGLEDEVDGLPRLDCTAGLADLTGGLDPSVPAEVDEDTLADVLFTSGTSGRPKAAEFTHGNCVACGVELAFATRMTSEDILQSAVPCFTSTGAHTNPLTALVAGAHYILEPRFDQHDTVRRWWERGTTVYFGVPTMLTLIVRDALEERGAPPSLRTLAFGGAGTTADGIRALARRFPGRDLVNLFGQTEGGPGGTALGPDDAVAKAGSLGCHGNGPATAFRVVDDHDRDAAVDEVGEIVFRSPAVMRGYYRDPERTADTLRGGWLHTGDLGRLDADGYLWLVDRKRDLIIRGGFNVSSLEVEEVITSHPSISEAAIIGVPHEVLGEDLFAYVVPSGKWDPAQVCGHARRFLADYKVPRHYEAVTELPRNAVGKVLKRQLRDRHATGLPVGR